VSLADTAMLYQYAEADNLKQYQIKKKVREFNIQKAQFTEIAH